MGLLIVDLDIHLERVLEQSYACTVAGTYINTAPVSTMNVSFSSGNLASQPFKIFCFVLPYWSEFAQSCPTLCNPHRLQPARLLCPWNSQARILEWVAISFSRGSSLPGDRTQGSNPGLSHSRQTLLTSELSGKPFTLLLKVILAEGDCLHHH